MGSTFPSGIVRFINHRDLLDDVDAADINKIQDEIVAIQQTLGDTINDIIDVESEVEILDNEADFQSDTQQTVISRFATLKDQVAAIWDGQHIHAAYASVSNKTLPLSGKNRGGPPNLVTLNKPDANADPMGLWNGTGFTLRKSGFYIAHGHVQMGLKPDVVPATTPQPSGNVNNTNRVTTFNVNQFDSDAQVRSDLDARLSASDIILLQETVDFDVRAYAGNHDGWAGFQVKADENDGKANTSILYRTSLGPHEDSDIQYVGIGSDTRARFLAALKFSGVWYVSVHIFPARDSAFIPDQIAAMGNWSAAHPAPQIWGLDKNQVTVSDLETATGLHWQGINIDGFLTGNGASVSNLVEFPSGNSDHPGVRAQSQAVGFRSRATSAADAPGPVDNSGAYEGSITINGTNWKRAVDRQYAYKDMLWHDVIVNPTLRGWFPKGTRLSLRAAQSSNHDQSIVTGGLAVYRVRGM